MAKDPPIPARSETVHVLDRRAPGDATASDSPAPMRAKITTHDLQGVARVDATASDPRIPMRSETTTQAPCALVHADTISGHQGVSALGPTDAEPSTAEPADVEALLGVDVTVAARRTSPTASTHATKASRPGSRGYVPAELRREVFARDGERCTYVSPDGDRCPARGHLELDHVQPKARGGTETAANLRVRCRAHNALYAEQVFGRAHVASRIDLRRRKCPPLTPTSSETAARGLRSLGFREPEARRALDNIATKRDMDGAPVETLLREALLVLT